MEPEAQGQNRGAEPSAEPSTQLKPRPEPPLSLTDRVIAFIDARMKIVEQKPAPQPMRKAG